MATTVFLPKKFQSFEHIETFSQNETPNTTNHEIHQSIELFRDSIEKWLSTDIWFRQIDWMWRGCYKKLDSWWYLIWKWTWPWLWSEYMRRFLDELHFAWAQGENKYWGCIRVDLWEQWPFLVQYNLDNEWKIEIIDPRPEGFSIFWATYREALAWNIYDKLWIEIVKPVALYRENSNPLWSWDKDAFRKKLSDAVVKSISIWNTHIKSCTVTKDDYHNLDAWILFRYAKTPYRISNLLDMCIKNDKLGLIKVLLNLIEKNDWDNLSPNDIYNLQTNVTRTIAKNAWLMFNNWIIHGQFKRHFQNISILWELSDFDSSIFLSLLPEQSDNNMIDTSTNQEALNFDSKLKQWELLYWLEMVNYLHSDLKLFTWLDDKWIINKKVLYSNIIWQIYDLFNQVMRLNDIFERGLWSENINMWFTVLNTSRYNELKNLFIETLKNILTQKWIQYIKDNILPCLDHFKSCYLSRDLWDVSVYGWQNRSKINYLDDTLTKEDIEKTFEEVKSLFNAITCK